MRGKRRKAMLIVPGLFVVIALAAMGGRERAMGDGETKPATTAGETASAPAGWVVKDTVELKGVTVGLSQPVLVARQREYLWFPTMVKLANGELLATMSTHADVNAGKNAGMACWSADGGLTWTKPQAREYGDSMLELPSGNELLLPYIMYPKAGGGMGAPLLIVPKGKREIKRAGKDVVVTGWPRPDQSLAPELGFAGFVFDGQTLRLKDGKYLATLYGYFKGEKRYSLVAAESSDGVAWKIRSIIDGADCKLKGGEGPCEGTIARLKDGRIMCVFRLDSNVPLGRTFSSDEGKNWSEPEAMPGPCSVQPSLAVLPDGTIALSTGRPGLFLWLNTDGTGKDWQYVNILGHHNAWSDEKIQIPGLPRNQTSSYTEVVALDATHLLYIYDRIPNGWTAIPEGSDQTNSVWVIRITLTKPGP